MKRKILSTLLVLCMLVSLLPTMALAAPVYGDTNGHWAADAIDRWSGYGVVNGKGEATFDPDGPMRRGEAAQMFANLLGLNKEGDISAYADAQGDWFTSAIAKCYAAGILNGKGDGVMDPNGFITREEFLTMYARAVCISNGTDPAEAKTGLEQKGFADTDKVSDWAADAIGTLVDKGYVNGMTATEIAPQANINRASVMALLDQSVSTYVGKDSTETTVAAKSEGITLIANPAVTTVTGTADVVVVAAGAEQYDTATGEIAHNDIRVESAKMPVARVQGENITVTLALSTTAEDATVTETGVDSIIVIESTAAVKNAAVAAEGAKIIVKDGAKAESVTVAETAKSATVETAKNATVGTVTIAAESATATVAGKVETVKVEETAKNATIDTKSTAKVETVENKAENTAVTGSGTVGAVKSSEDVKVETKNTKVENTSETKDIAVTDSKGTETKVETKTEGTTTTKTETTVNKQETTGDGGGGHSHSYKWETKNDATCTEDGKKVGTCTCGDTKTEIIPKLGHNFVNGVCSRCRAKSIEIDDADKLKEFVSNTDYDYGIIADDFDVEGTVFCDRNSDFTIDFNGKTVNFESEYSSSKGSTNFGAFSIESGKTITLTDSSLEKTGKFVNTATTASGNVYLVGIYSSTDSSVIIDGLNIEMNSASSTQGQIYGVVCSKTSGKTSDKITVKNSKITLKASTGSTAGAFIYADYCNNIVVDNCEIDSTGSGKMIRTGSSSVANISNSKFDVETDPNSYDSITALDIGGANTVIDNVEINAEGYISNAISVKSNATVKNSKISVIAGTKGEPKGILVQGTEGTTLDNCEVYVSSETDSASYTAKGIALSSADNVVIKNCNIIAENLGETTNLPKSIYFNSTTPKNRVEDSFCTGEVYGVNVISGHYSSDPIDWVLNGYTTSTETSKGKDWYVVKEAGSNDYVCTLSYVEDSTPQTERFTSVIAAIRKASTLKQENMLLTIMKDCSLSSSAGDIYSDIEIEEGITLDASSLSLKDTVTGTITNNGTLNCSSLTIKKNWTFNNYGTVSVGTLTINAGTADKDGNVTGSAAALNNEGTITVSSKLTMITLSGYALNNTTPETKELLKPKFVNNGDLVGVDSTSTLAANYGITGTHPYPSETYKWNDGSWTIGGAVKNLTKDKNYDSLSTAISEANADDELKLFADFQPSSYEITKNLTIDLNGHVLDFWNYSNVSGKAKAFTIDGATLTIDDKSENHNGKIIATAGAAIWIKDNSSLVLNNGIIENTGRGGNYSCVVLIADDDKGTAIGASNASLVVNGGQIIASSEEWTDPLSNEYYFPGDGIYIYGHGEESGAPSITMTAGVISANGTAISGQGSYDYANISISGGAVTSFGGCAMYLPQKGITNITGGTIEGKTGICIKGGTLNISAGTITGVGEKNIPSEALGSGTNLTGDAIYVEDNYTQRAINVSITGGTLTSTNGYQIQRLFPVEDIGYETVINVNNATITSTNGLN